VNPGPAPSVIPGIGERRMERSGIWWGSCHRAGLRRTWPAAVARWGRRYPAVSRRPPGAPAAAGTGAEPDRHGGHRCHGARRRRDASSAAVGSGRPAAPPDPRPGWRSGPRWL